MINYKLQLITKLQEINDLTKKIIEIIETEKNLIISDPNIRTRSSPFDEYKTIGLLITQIKDIYKMCKKIVCYSSITQPNTYRVELLNTIEKYSLINFINSNSENFIESNKKICDRLIEINTNYKNNISHVIDEIETYWI